MEGMEGMSVTKGQLIGRTGESASSGFDHLHFEIRAGGLRQDSNCNPWKYLPCEHCSSFNVNLTVIPNDTEDGEECSVTVQVSVPPNQLTFNRVRLVATGGAINYDKDFDLCVDNKYYTNNPTYAPTRLDNSTLIDYLTIIPHFFNSQSYAINQWSATDYKFKSLSMSPGDIGMVTAYAYDVFENEVFSSPVQYFCPADMVYSTSTVVPSSTSSTGASLTTGTPSPSSTVTSIESTDSSAGTIHSTGMIYCLISTGWILFYLTVLYT